MTEPKLHSRWLLLSMAANLFLVGYVVAGLVRPQDRPPPPPRPMMMLEQMSEALSPEGRAVMTEIIAANSMKLEQLQVAMMTARVRVRDVFAQEPFDPVAFQAASDQGFAAAQAFFQALGGALAQAGARLSVEDRKRLRPIGPPPPR